MKDAIDDALIRSLNQGLPLCDHPFAQVGRAHGLAEADVIERLELLLAGGRLASVGPLFDPVRASRPGFDPLERQLIDATQSGLPLVPEPYEALGALLGVSAVEIQSRLASLISRGVIRRIAAVGYRGS